jgi:hypothetical protein
MKRFSILSALTVGLALAFAGVARADTTLGLTSQPSLSSATQCPSDSVINQVQSGPNTPYSVPGSGTITKWQTDMSDSDPGAQVMLVVLRPVGASFTVVAVNNRLLPSVPPADNVASFTLGTPIAVTGGETFGLYTNGGPVTCYWHGGSTPLGNTLARLDALSAPAPNQTLNRNTTDSPAGYTMDLAATFVPTPTTTPTPTPTPTPTKKKCKKKHKKRSASSAKKKCKKKKKR